MTEQELERLSALVDDEIPLNEMPMEIKKLSINASSREQWSHYHLIGDVMRGETGGLIAPGLAQAISERIQDEPVVIAPASLRRHKAKRRHTYTGVAVAASLAAAAVVMVPQMINPEGSDMGQPTLATTQTTSPETLYVADNGTRWELLKKPKVESRLNAYLVNHQELSPANNMKGIMPFANFVSYDENKQ